MFLIISVAYVVLLLSRFRFHKGSLGTGWIVLSSPFNKRRYWFCTSFMIRDELNCCINATAFSAQSFTTFILGAAAWSSWYGVSLFHSVGSFARKFCAFNFPFNDNTWRIAKVLSITQLAKPWQTMARVDWQDISRNHGTLESVFSQLVQMRLFQFCHERKTA